MFKLITIEDVVRIPPEKFGKSIEEVALEQIKMKYENLVDDELGYVILVVNVELDEVGKILPETAQLIINLPLNC